MAALFIAVVLRLLRLIGNMPLKICVAVFVAVGILTVADNLRRRMSRGSFFGMLLAISGGGALLTAMYVLTETGYTAWDGVLIFMTGAIAITLIYSVVYKYKRKRTMRKKIVAGNWKMNTTPAQGVELAKAVAEGRKGVDDSVQFIVCPPFTHLCEVIKATRGTGIAVGAQNCAAEAKGAYTGEVSAEMIASLGVEYVLLGHSERREYYGETSETLNKKMKQAYDNNLIPIYCIGEKLDEREAGRQNEIVRAQIEEVVCNLAPEQFGRLVIAYEPVWAIGTGKTATADQAEEMHAYIRGVLAGKFGAAAESTVILYGGSCNPGNAKELFGKRNVDGGLIGGASLKADDFIAIGKSY